MKIKFYASNIFKSTLKTILFVVVFSAVYYGLMWIFKQPMSVEHYTLSLLCANIFQRFVEQGDSKK